MAYGPLVALSDFSSRSVPFLAVSWVGGAQAIPELPECKRRPDPPLHIVYMPRRMSAFGVAIYPSRSFSSPVVYVNLADRFPARFTSSAAACS